LDLTELLVIVLASFEELVIILT